MYSYKTGLGQVWVGSKLPPNSGSNIIWLRPSDDHRVLWEIRTYNIYKEKWEVLTSAALTAEGLLVLIRDLEKDVKSLQELKAVLYDTVQDLTPEQQQIARQNIGAVSLEDLPFDETVTRLAIELTINDEKVYSVVTPLETLTEHYRKFLADPTKYVWQLYLKVGEDQLGLVPLFIITYGGLHIGFYSPDTSGETKYVSLNTNGDVVIRATVNNYGPTLVEVVQSTGDSIEKVMSQKTVTEELDKKASLESVTDSISVHNTSSTSHADIRELLNTCVGLPAYDSSSYKITFTTLAGASVEIDLPIEQLALRYNVETESIEFDNADGTTTSIPVSAFVKEYVGSIGDQIQVSIDTNNVIHATVLKNSIDWDSLSLALQERINSHVSSEEFATQAIRTDIKQTLSIESQNQALENIGADLMIIDLVNGQATLTDEQETRLLSCKGVILRGTVNAGKEVLTKIYFSDYQGGDQVSFWAVRNNRYILQCIYTKSTKLFRFLTSSSFIDPNAVSIKAQTLNATEQAQAFANLGMKVYVTDSSFLGSTLSAEEIKELVASKVLLLTDTGDLFLFGSEDSNRISFYQFTNNYYVGCVTIRKDTYYVSSKINYPYQDTKALHFTAQNPALTSAQQSQAFENLGWKVHVISESVIGSSDAVSDDEKAARLSATALLVQETGLLYNFSISSGGSRRFYGQFSNSFCTALNVNEATGVITSSFTYLYDPSAVSFDRNQSSVSDDNKNKALGNIGIDLVRLPYSLLGTTLSDEMANVINNARGIILVDTPNDFILPTIYNKGRTTSSNAKFITIGETKDMYYILYNKNTKALANVVHTYTDSGCVRYVQEQNLTNTEKDTVLSNIGLDFVHVDYSLLNTTLSDADFNRIWNAKGLVILGNDDIPATFIKGSHGSTKSEFYGFNDIISFNYITLSASSKRLSNISAHVFNLGSVTYNTTQTLTDAQKQQARTNINAVGSSMIKGVEIVYGTAPMQEDNILYIELEETT